MVVVAATVGCCDVSDDDPCKEDEMQTALDLHSFDWTSKSFPSLQLLGSGSVSLPGQS